MAEDLYGVTFEDSETTYLVALFDTRGEAENYAEKLAEDAESEAGAGPTEYDVEEIDPEFLGDVGDVRERLARNMAVALD